MKFISIIAFVLLFILSTLFIFVNNQKEDIKIGLLYSKTGTMASEEDVIAKMLHYGVEKINEDGGILGTKIEIIEYDGKSDSKEFAKGAEFLTNQGIKFIFGCWTSASRKAVKPIVDKNNALLFYPVQFEGAEESKNIIYLGETPNQQINPTITYIQQNFGQKIYIVGSDYIYPRMAELYIQNLSKNIDIEIVGSSFIPLGSNNVNEIVKDIKNSKPNAVINLLNGSSNLHFFQVLKESKISPQQTPVFSMSVDESSLNKMKTALGNNILDGHYTVWNYFSSIGSSENINFIKELQTRYGEEFILTSAGYNIYLALEFWVKGMKLSKDFTLFDVKQELARDSIQSLSGVVYLDRENFHTHKSMKIAMVNEGRFDIVWDSEVLTHPKPFAFLKSKEFAKKYQEKLYEKWDKTWQAPLKGEKDE